MDNDNLSNSFNPSREIKITCVGDGYIGKTCLLLSFVYKKFPADYVPTVFESHAMKTTHQGTQYTLQLFDTAGQEDWDNLRIMAYPETDVVVLCFSLVRPDSMDNVKSKWVPELKEHLKDVPIVLVGTQMDLRNESSGSVVPQRAGEELRSNIKAYKYIECSALTQVNIAEVFDSCIAAYAAFKSPSKKSSLFSQCFSCVSAQPERHSSNRYLATSSSKKRTKK